MFHYLIVDGHVELKEYDDPDIIGFDHVPGDASLDRTQRPRGAWTITAGD